MLKYLSESYCQVLGADYMKRASPANRAEMFDQLHGGMQVRAENWRQNFGGVIDFQHGC